MSWASARTSVSATRDGWPDRELVVRPKRPGGTVPGCNVVAIDEDQMTHLRRQVLLPDHVGDRGFRRKLKIQPIRPSRLGREVIGQRREELQCDTHGRLSVTRWPAPRPGRLRR